MSDDLRCDGEGWIDFPEKYNRYGAIEELDPPGVWMEPCSGCEHCEPEEEEDDG
jgi:hypothetical protein